MDCPFRRALVVPGFLPSVSEELNHAASLLISDDVDATDLLSRIIRGSGQITLDRFFYPSPTHYALATTLNTLALDVVFLDVSFPDRAFTSYEQIKQINPACP